jgi:hypothetical protein
VSANQWFVEPLVRCLREILILFIFAFIAAAPLAAQQQINAAAGSPWWYTLEQGKNLFRSGDYGSALLTFEDARRQRFAMYERMERDVISLLSIGEVRRLGDSLDWVERYANDRHYAAATAAFNELFYRYPKASFNNSAAAALEALGKLTSYPEAEYWIGETCRAEGELSLALSQFQKAYSLRELFENPGFDIELLYKIADIYKNIHLKNSGGSQYNQRAYNEMERTLLSIIETDTLWSNSQKADRAASGETVPYIEASASFARQAMTRTLENEGLGRFLALYRYNNAQVEEAHRLLGFYYSLSGRPRSQEHLMFAFLIQNSIIIEEVKRRQADFTFTGLAALTEEINRSPLLADYASKVDYYKTAYYLGVSLYSNGKTAAARELWIFLAARIEAAEWRDRAAGQLRRPHTEPVVEMP